MRFLARRCLDDGASFRALCSAATLADEAFDALVAACKAVIVDEILVDGLGVAAFAQRQFKWYRVIIDEAHSIKSRGGVYAKGAAKLEAENRWCFTGTPMMNDGDPDFRRTELELASMSAFSNQQPHYYFISDGHETVVRLSLQATVTENTYTI